MVSSSGAWIPPLFLFGVSLALPCRLSAQNSAAAPVDAVATEDLQRHLDILAADSMRAPGVANAALERTAQYVADEFRRLGLAPGGDNGTWFQRYPTPGQLRVDYAASQFVFVAVVGRGSAKIRTENGYESWKNLHFSFADAARFVEPPEEVPPWGGLDRAVVVLAGRQTLASVQQANLANSLVIYVPSVEADSMLRRQILDELRTITRWVILSDDQDASAFAQAAQRSRERPVRLAPSYLYSNGSTWTVAVRQSVLAGCLAGAGIDLEEARSATTPIVQSLPLVGTGIQMVPEKTAGEPLKAPNVVGLLEGTDPKLKERYLVVTGRMDQSFTGRSNVEGLLMLAKAFRQSRAPLRRSVAFVATTEGPGGWRSRAFLAQGQSVRKPVFHLALELAPREAGDSVVTYGAPDFELANPLSWMVATHPELQVTLVDGGTAVDPTLDDFAFVANGVPSLSLHPMQRGTAPGSRLVQDVDPERSARFLRLAYFIGQTVVNADQSPQWSTEGRRRLMEVSSP